MLTSKELYNLCRSDLQDEVTPYLWSDVNVYAYMNDAYTSFVRQTGGVPDSSSAVTQVPVVAGAATALVSPLILRFRQAFLLSTGEEVNIINEQDRVYGQSQSDYGIERPLLRDTRTGKVRFMVVGEERTQAGATVRWVQVPEANDTVSLVVYRLPLDTISVGDGFFTFPDINTEHIEHLVSHMKARAYDKHDADTFNKGKRDAYKKEFNDYCAAVKAEWERYKHKTRTVQYGGI